MDGKKKTLALLTLAPWASMFAQQAATQPQQAWSLQAEQQSGVWSDARDNAMGTSLEMRFRAPNRATAELAEAAALAAIERGEQTLSAWRKDSEFTRWQATRFTAVKVSDELYATLEAFDRWRLETDGALDPSVAAAMRVWRAAAEEARKPSAAEIAAAREAMRQEHWSLDPAQRTATRLSDAPLALASFVKSRIAEEAAKASIHAGATGVMLNCGGDVIVRGEMSTTVAIADPRSRADNDAIAEAQVRDRAVATSGGYWRGFNASVDAAMRAPEFSHLIDPRTASPVRHVLSSTVIAREAETAGALATAFSVLPIDESLRIAAAHPEVDYLIVAADGRREQSRGWAQYEPLASRLAQTKPVLFVTSEAKAAGQWNAAMELVIDVELPHINDARYRRPYVAVWVEDESHFPVRTLALWANNTRWMPDLKQWYREDRLRAMAEGTDITRTVGSATRPPGKYVLRWDGKDNEGKFVKAGNYTIVVEAVRENGGYQIQRLPMNFTGKPARATMAAGAELGATTLEYRKR